MNDHAMARQFKALAHPRRMMIYRILSLRPETGNSLKSLQDASGLADGPLNHHLREMESAGLLRRQRRGTYVTFRLETQTFLAALAGADSLAHHRQLTPRAA